MTRKRQECPDPEVPERARRRSFTAQCKLDVVAGYDAAPAGGKGAVLRRGRRLAGSETPDDHTHREVHK